MNNHTIFNNNVFTFFSCKEVQLGIINLLSVISLCLLAIVICGCLCLVLVPHIIRKRVQREHIENIDSVLSTHSIVDDESEI